MMSHASSKACARRKRRSSEGYAMQTRIKSVLDSVKAATYVNVVGTASCRSTTTPSDHKHSAEHGNFRWAPSKQVRSTIHTQTHKRPSLHQDEFYIAINCPFVKKNGGTNPRLERHRTWK
eukprot:3427630-Amphidinium_carterae.1